MKHPVDKYVGSRLRFRRIASGISQDKLGEMVGVTYQQIQKYEKGINRMGSSRLYQFARILLVPISYFFDGYESHEEIQDTINEKNIDNAEVTKLVKNFLKIKNKETRKSVIVIAKNAIVTGKDGGSDE
jgi:transcriptional regulator with XRE-family HTH domain